MAPSGGQQFGRFWARLKYTGQEEPPNRSTVGAQLMQRSWFHASDIYSFIALQNRREFEIVFHHEKVLRSFILHFQVWAEDNFWKDWEVVSSVPQDVVNIVVKFWTGRVADEDVDHYLSRYCVLLQPAEKLLDQFGMWYGVRRYKVKLRRNSNGELIQIPNTIAMGPYTGKISYTGQIQKCYICSSTEHQVKDCDQVKCWKCGQLGHKGKMCANDEVCGLCGEQGHSFFSCPKSYSNQVKARRSAAQISNQN